jgi:hypothetical protein
MVLCKDCKHCKTVPVGHVSFRSWCKILPRKNRGVQNWRKMVRPGCPLKENREVRHE